MRILVTGGNGFIGSNFIEYMINKHLEIEIINVDSLTYAANTKNLIEIENDKRYKFIEGDITDEKFINNLLNSNEIDHVVHFAAESHVDNSIASPGKFISTNIIGTFNLLEACRTYWGETGKNRFVHVSTDEVYGSLGDEGFFTEESRYEPNSPYSASKASSDMLVRSYYHTYNLNVITTNCSNNFGPKQHEEKLIPTIIKNAIRGHKIPIYGDGKNIRDWLYVIDHCKGIEKVLFHGSFGDTYLIGCRNEKTNLEITYEICDILDKLTPKNFLHKELITFIQDRKGHDIRYAIDPSKIESELDFGKTNTFQEDLMRTVKFYIDKYKN